MSATPHDRLRELAQILDCPVDTFYSAARASDDLSGLTELFRLWLAMGTSEDRAHLLATARYLVARRPGNPTGT